MKSLFKLILLVDVKNSNIKTINNSTAMLKRLKDCFTVVSAEFIVVYKYSRILKKALYAICLINILEENTDLLNYLNRESQKHLSSILKRYGKQAIEVLKQKTHRVEEISDLTISLARVIETLDNLPSNNIKENNPEPQLKAVIDLIENFMGQCCSLISADSEQLDHVAKFQATTIAVNLAGNLNNLAQEQFNLFLEQLLLIKELWQIDRISGKKESIILLFHTKILPLLLKDKLTDYKLALEKIINFLIKDHNVLTELSNAKLVSLYNSLKDVWDNVEITREINNEILKEIHEESKFRLNCNKINDGGYELVKLFESYNTILHQIENAEFAIVEKFLLKKHSLSHEVLINITKHIDAIRILSITENPALLYIFQKIRQELTHNIQNGHTIALMISSVESKLSSNINPKIIKRYGTFDKFTTNSLKNRYQLLFENVISLLQMTQNYREFIQYTITYKIASDYNDYKVHINRDSSATLRVIHQERIEIMKQLGEINFIELFSDRYLNKISSLNLKKYTRKEKPKSPLLYIKLVVQLLLDYLTVEQLQLLVRFLIDGNLVTIHMIVKEELLLQVKNRMTFGKILYYIFTRRKK